MIHTLQKITVSRRPEKLNLDTDIHDLYATMSRSVCLSVTLDEALANNMTPHCSSHNVLISFSCTHSIIT